MIVTILFFIRETLKSFLRSKVFIWPFLKELEDISKMNQKEIQELEDVRFVKLFKIAYNRSSFYRELYKNYNIKESDITGLNDRHKLPHINKEQVRNNSDKILTQSKIGLVKSKTSGTTGTPLSLYFSLNFLLRDFAYIYYYRKKLGCQGVKTVSLRGSLGRDRLKQFVFTNKTLYLSSYNIRKDTCEIYFQLIKKYKPKVIEGYPSSIYNLALLFKEKSYNLSIPIVFTSSETLFPHQKVLIENIFESRVFDVYGNSERTISLRQDPFNGSYFAPAGYCSLDKTEEGLFTTNLNNIVFPLIRYKIDDDIEVDESLNVCNQFFPSSPSLPKVKSIIGRVEDVIIGKDGTLYGRLDFILKGINNVKIAQIVQRKKGELNLHIVPDVNYSKKEEQGILKNIAFRFGVDNMECKIIKVNSSDIIYSKSNKFKFVISLTDTK